MTKKKRLFTIAAGSALGLGLFASSSFAGPIMLAPAPMPVVHTAPAVGVPVKNTIPQYIPANSQLLAVESDRKIKILNSAFGLRAGHPW